MRMSSRWIGGRLVGERLFRFARHLRGELAGLDHETFVPSAGDDLRVVADVDVEHQLSAFHLREPDVRGDLHAGWRRCAVA